MSTTMATISYNENEHIEEFFIYYHDILGCEQILFYDDSDDDIQKNICSYYPDYVTYIPWLGKGHIEANNHALSLCTTQHIGFFDIDEFLALKQYKNIYEYIDQTFIDDVSIVYFNWRIFSPMGYECNPQKPVTSAYTKCLCAEHKGFDLKVEKWNPQAVQKYIVDKDACTWAGIHRADVTGKAVSANLNGNYEVVQLNHYQSKSVKSAIIKDL